MHPKMLAYFNQFLALNEEEIATIGATVQLRSYAREEMLLALGQVPVHSFFVVEGWVRKCYWVQGQEHISEIYGPGEWAISYNPAAPDAVADHSLICTTACSVCLGTPSAEEEIYQRFPRLQAVARKVMLDLMNQHTAQLAALSKESPEERYVNLCRQKPELVQNVPQYQIASLLGIKPESLSRIRKRLRNGV